MSEVKNESDDSTDEEHDSNEDESDRENDPGPIFESDEGSESEGNSDAEEEDEDSEEEGEEIDEDSQEVEGSDDDNKDEITNQKSDDNVVKSTDVSKKSKINRTTSKKLELNSASGKKKVVKSIDKFNAEVKKSARGENSQNENEYENDTSDEEDIRNTVGNIPMNWYDDYPHLGYDWDGKKILKPKKSDQLDEFLRRMEDPNFWRTVKDPQTGQDVVLSDADMTLIERMQKGKIPDADFDEYAVSFEFDIFCLKFKRKNV